MDSVNEIVFGRKMEAGRPAWEDCFYIDTCASVIERPEHYRVKDGVKKIANAGIRNVGEKGALELVSAVAIFLTQVPEKLVDDVETARIRRNSDLR